MKRRVSKKQVKKVVGYMASNGLKVVNTVSSRDYNGGTCVERDEDCQRFEVTYTRKRYGAPLCVKSKHAQVFYEIYGDVHNRLNP